MFETQYFAVQSPVAYELFGYISSIVVQAVEL